MAMTGSGDEAQMSTLSDFLAPGLRILSIGLNPSLRSVAAGYYFANPRNRFWKALYGSALVTPQPPWDTPGEAAQAALLAAGRLGFTDVVKRPTAGAGDLRAADYARDAPRLREKILTHAPRVAWFHGRVAYRAYLKHAEGLGGRAGAEAVGPWGFQTRTIGPTRVFVCPNPSPANAQFSLGDLIGYYSALAAGALDSRPAADNLHRSGRGFAN